MDIKNLTWVLFKSSQCNHWVISVAGSKHPASGSMHWRGWCILRSWPWIGSGTDPSNICRESLYYQTHFIAVLTFSLTVCNIESVFSVFINAIDVSFPLLWTICSNLCPLSPLVFHLVLTSFPYMPALQLSVPHTLLVCCLLCVFPRTRIFNILLDWLWTHKKLFFVDPPCLFVSQHWNLYHTRNLLREICEVGLQREFSYSYTILISPINRILILLWSVFWLIQPIHTNRYYYR